MHPKDLVVAATILAVAAALAPSASAGVGDDFVHINLAVKESGCEGASWCFDVKAIQGRIAAGSTLEITLANHADNSSPHNLCVTFGDDFDPAHKNTPEMAAEACMEDVAPDDAGFVDAVVPEGASSIYYWCDVGGHETLGMWGTLEVLGSGAEDDAGPEDANGTPGFGVALAVLGLGTGLVLARRRAFGR